MNIREVRGEEGVSFWSLIIVCLRVCVCTVLIYKHIDRDYTTSTTTTTTHFSIHWTQLLLHSAPPSVASLDGHATSCIYMLKRTGIYWKKKREWEGERANNGNTQEERKKKKKELKKGCARVWNTRAFSLLLSSDLQHFVCVCAAAKERRGDERHKEINKTHTHTYNGEFLCRLHLQHIVVRPSIILVAHTAQSETRKNFVTTTTDTHTHTKLANLCGWNARGRREIIHKTNHASGQEYKQTFKIPTCRLLLFPPPFLAARKNMRTRHFCPSPNQSER